MTVTRPHDPRAAYLICLVLAAVTILAFLPVLDAGFVGYDDDYQIKNNPHVHAGLTGPSLAWAFTTFAVGNWRPLTWISHMLDCQLYGLNPAGHHVTSLALHVTSVLLLFVALSRLTNAPWKSALVAALFSVHPLQVESVAWIAARGSVLSTVFWMLTLLAYISYARRGGLAKYVPVVLLLTLGLLSKPMLVSLPIVLLILDYWPLRKPPRLPNPDTRQSSWFLVGEKLPLFALSAASCVVTYYAQRGGTGPGVSRLGDLALSVRLDNAVVSYVAYLVKMVWPAKLAVIYPHPLRSILVWHVAGSGLLLVLISVAAIQVRKTRPYVLAGWLWYVITLIPVIGLVQVGEQSMADRYAYVPLIGIFVIIAWGVPDLLGKRFASRQGRLALACVAGALMAVLIVRTHVQAGYWRDSVSLFTRTLQVTRNNYVAHLNLGAALEAREDWDAAKRHYEEALRLQPDWPEALYNYGVLMGKTGNPDAAIAFYRRTLRIRPEHVDAHYNLGIIYDEQGRTAAAIREYEAALRLAPNYVAAHNNLAVALYYAGQYERAWRHVHEAQALGFSPHEGFLKALSSKMPEPAR